MTHREPSEEALERAAMYLGGALTPDERTAFEREIHGGRAADLEAALATLSPGIEALADACTPLEPAPRVLEAVLRAADELQRSAPEETQPWRDWSSDAAEATLYTLRADEGSWDDTGVEGVQVRRLFVDRHHNRMTAMFRMAPGTAYPSHVHDGPEECMVLEGDLHVGDELVLRAGDYQRAAEGSEHVVQWTEGGCVLLITSSLSDEMV